MQCEDARPLIASYADGELTEAQATPLRRHLMSCSACRVLAQDEKALKRWFASAAAENVPAGFAARVARRAFAGDTGERMPATATPIDDRARLEGFVLRLASLAAAAAIVCAFIVRQDSLPASDNMRADVVAPSLEELRRELQELNEGAETTDTGAAEGEGDAPR